jgi:hypothetical protein
MMSALFLRRVRGKIAHRLVCIPDILKEGHPATLPTMEDRMDTHLIHTTLTVTVTASTISWKLSVSPARCPMRVPPRKCAATHPVDSMLHTLLEETPRK